MILMEWFTTEQSHLNIKGIINSYLTFIRKKLFLNYYSICLSCFCVVAVVSANIIFSLFLHLFVC